MGSSNDFFNSLRKQLSNGINVSAFAIVNSWDSSKNTVDVIPLTTNQGQQMPMLINVPVLYFNVGGYKIKHPINTGNVVLVIFNDYDIDNLLLNGTVENNTDRVHDLNDAVALPLSFNAFNNDFEGSDDLVLSHSKSNTEIKITPNGAVSVTASKILLNTDGDGEGVALGESIKSAFDSHTHPIVPNPPPGSGYRALGPTGTFPSGSSTVKVGG